MSKFHSSVKAARREGPEKCRSRRAYALYAVISQLTAYYALFLLIHLLLFQLVILVDHNYVILATEYRSRMPLGVDAMVLYFYYLNKVVIGTPVFFFVVVAQLCLKRACFVLLLPGLWVVVDIYIALAPRKQVFNFDLLSIISAFSLLSTALLFIKSNAKVRRMRV